MRHDVPLPDADDRLPAGPAHPQQLAQLSDRWGLGGSVGRLTAALAAVAG